MMENENSPIEKKEKFIFLVIVFFPFIFLSLKFILFLFFYYIANVNFFTFFALKLWVPLEFLLTLTLCYFDTKLLRQDGVNFGNYFFWGFLFGVIYLYLRVKKVVSNPTPYAYRFVMVGAFVQFNVFLINHYAFS